MYLWCISLFCLLLCLSIRGFYGLFPLVSTRPSISVRYILCLNVSMLYDVCKSVWLELILLGLITSWQIRTPHLLKCTHAHTPTHIKVLAFTFMQCYCCYLRFLSALITNWSIVSVIFQSIDQAHVAFFRY